MAFEVQRDDRGDYWEWHIRGVRIHVNLYKADNKITMEHWFITNSDDWDFEDVKMSVRELEKWKDVKLLDFPENLLDKV